MVFGKDLLTRKTAFQNSNVLASANGLLASIKKVHGPRPAFVPDFHYIWPVDFKNESRLGGGSFLQLGPRIREGCTTRLPNIFPHFQALTEFSATVLVVGL